MPIRRLNYTKRKKLTREQVRVRLTPSDNGAARAFDAELKLPPGLPGDARVFVEAYLSSPATRMRFDFGSVDAILPPPLEARRLHEFHADMPAPLFRVKVTDVREAPGRLLADAQKIRPVDPDEKPDQKRGILYTSWRDNDGPVWELEFDDPRGPLLFIDKTADPGRDLPGKTEFVALVYPEIIRRSLTWVLIDADGDESISIEDPELWYGKWLNFPRDAFGFTEAHPGSDADEATKRMWIDAAVGWCSRKAGFCQAIASLNAPKEEDS